MGKKRQPPGARDSLTMLREQTHAWWTKVLAGQTPATHPVHGTNVRAHVDGKTLVITGTVPSRRDRREIEHETEHLIHGHDITQVRSELTIANGAAEQEGLLAQTLIAVFETEDQAGFAAGYLEGHARFTAEMMHVVTPDQHDRASAVIHALLPSAYWDDAEQELCAGRALLIATVDELDAFTARALLAEETPSLRTLTLPPEPAANAARAEAALRHAGRGDGSPAAERSTRVRRQTRNTERATHER